MRFHERFAMEEPDGSRRSATEAIHIFWLMLADFAVLREQPSYFQHNPSRIGSMQSGVTVSCFFLSYVIVLALELSRLYTRMPWRMVIVIMMAIVGLVTHGLFLLDRWIAETQSMGKASLPATLFDWSLLAAWVLAAIYVFLAIRRPTNAIGPFLLPLVLGMILGALAVRSGQPFDRTASTGLWRYIHGGSLSLGTVAVTLGLAVAMMNLVQEYRLKTKRGMAGSLRLPSLEYLHTLGRGCLVVSTIAIACGLVSGVVLNFQRNGSVNWLESGIIFSGGLLVWLVIASILEWQASLRATSWAAYLNIASFLIVFLALVLVFAAPHGRTRQLSPSSETRAGSVSDRLATQEPARKHQRFRRFVFIGSWFPGSAWEPIDLQALPAEATKANGDAGGGASKTVRSQAEPGNERYERSLIFRSSIVPSLTLPALVSKPFRKLRAFT